MNWLRYYFIELSQREKDRYLWYLLDVKSKKYYKPFYQTETDLQDIEKKIMVTKREVGGGISWEYGINSCTIPNIF